jgi:hypothetical protein
MCLDCEPENDHSCCKLRLTITHQYAWEPVPKIYTRRVGKRHFDTLYAVWAEWNTCVISSSLVCRGCAEQNTGATIKFQRGCL